MLASWQLYVAVFASDLVLIQVEDVMGLGAVGHQADPGGVGRHVHLLQDSHNEVQETLEVVTTYTSGRIQRKHEVGLGVTAYRGKRSYSMDK